MKKYIVTGGAGFIGSHLVEFLLQDSKVVVLDDLSSGYERYLPQHPNLTFLKVDISDWNALSRCFNYFRNADGVFHVAARARIQPSINNPEESHRINVSGTFNILEMMRMMGIKKIVYSASSSSYGLKAKLPNTETMQPDCLNPYALTKWMGEEYCKTWGKLYGISNVCLKYFNVYGERSALTGPYAPVVGLFFRQALQEKQDLTVVGDGNQRRDMTYVSDVVRANFLAMERCQTISGETINIGTGRNYTINQLALMVSSAIKSLGVYPVGVTYIPPRPAEARETLADISKAKALLDWEPEVVLDKKIYDLAMYYQVNLSD